MSGRIVSVYERVADRRPSTTSSTSSRSRFRATASSRSTSSRPSNISAAQAQVTSISQTILKQLPAGITPPQMLVYNASSVPIIQLALSSDTLSQTALNDLAHELHPARSSRRSRARSCPTPMAAPRGRSRSTSTRRRCTPTASRPPTSARALARQNLITPVGTAEDRLLRMDHRPQRFAEDASTTSTICRSRWSTAPSSSCATSPTSTTARRRRPMSCSSTAARAC